MKVKKLALIAAIFLHGFILNTHAADKEYKCTVHNMYKLSNSGEIKLVEKNVPKCFFGDMTFRILRDTGKIIKDNNCPPLNFGLYGPLWEGAKNSEGNFQADDPSTPDVDEAWIDNEGNYRKINTEPVPGKNIVVDRGNYNSSFKLVNIHTPDNKPNKFRALEVLEDADQKEKPFYSTVTGGAIVSGICL